MAIVEQRVKIFGGSAGPGKDSVPVYGDDNAPNGKWAYDVGGVKQLLLKNGMELIRVNPDLLQPGDNDRGQYYSMKPNGMAFDYARVWIIDPATGHGANLQPMWIEFSHLVPATSPGPDPDPIPGDDEWVQIDYRFENGLLYLKMAKE